MTNVRPTVIWVRSSDSGGRKSTEQPGAPRAGQCLSASWSLLLALAGLLLLPAAARSQGWSWKVEAVDQSARFSSAVVDHLGNLHVAYIKEPDGIKYGFRPAGSSQWFTTAVDRRMGFVRLAVDREGNPHLCYNSSGELWYAHWDSERWMIQQIAPGSGEISYSCSVAVSPDGTPHLIWYQYGGQQRAFYLHIKYAVLRGGAWLARTIDFDGETGKWNSMAVGPQGNPCFSYSAFGKGALKHACWDGKRWTVSEVDARSDSPNNGLNRGFGNSMVLDSQGNAHISYFDENAVKYAEQHGKTWSIQVVDSVPPAVDWAAYRSTVLLDQRGFPHIVYENAGSLKHAYWDEKQWHVQLITAGGQDPYRFSSAAIDPQGTIYISYRDPGDGSLKVAVGHAQTALQATVADKDKKD